MVLRFVVPKAAEAPIWNFSPTIPALSLHHPVKMEPVVGLGLLACPSCSSRQLCRLRNLHQFALNSCDNTSPGKIFNRSFKERSPSAQWTLTKMILRLGARFGARLYIEKSLRKLCFAIIAAFPVQAQ